MVTMMMMVVVTTIVRTIKMRTIKMMGIIMMMVTMTMITMGMIIRTLTTFGALLPKHASAFHSCSHVGTFFLVFYPVYFPKLVDLPAASAGGFEHERKAADHPHRALRHRPLVGLGIQHGDAQGPRAQKRHRKVSKKRGYGRTLR